MRFELHCHSTCSDGTESPIAVAARAAERKVAVFALTDHDTCAGSAVTVAGARAIRAVELSCDDDGRTVHILAYDRRSPIAGGGDPDGFAGPTGISSGQGGAGPLPRARSIALGHGAGGLPRGIDRGGPWSVLEAKLAAVREARKNRVRVMAQRLTRRGITIDVESLIAEAEQAASAGRSMGRPDLARAMVAAGAASSIQDAFARHLYDGGPVDVPHHALPLGDAIAIGRDAGAAMSLAHPHLYGDRSAHYLRRHKADGLTGLEAFYGAYDPRERARWIALADQLGVTCTGGSDWHGPETPNVAPGVDLPDDRSAALLSWLS
jgi:predicted metal-dependent phosphoesterase TrpH